MKIELNQLIELYNSGKHENLEVACQEFLNAHRQHAYAWHLAAANAVQLGRFEQGLERVQMAIKLQPQEISFYNTLGSIYRQMGRMQEACRCYKQALELDPNSVECLYNFANFYRDSGEFRRAVELYQNALNVNVQFHAARINLANLYRHLCDSVSAEREFRSLIELGAESVEVVFGLGQSLSDQGEYEEAEGYFRRVVQALPEDPNAVFYLANVLWAQGKISEAEGYHRQSVARMPKFHQAWNNLGNDLRDQGEQQQALACYRKAIELHPSYMQAHSNLLFELNCMLTDGAVLLEEHHRWDEMHAKPLLQQLKFDNERSAGRRLRIGYVSSDFCNHSVAYFIEGVLKHHDAEKFEISCYSNLLKPDDRTAVIRSFVHNWREIGHLSDDAAAQLIRSDQIDILVDLSGHTANHRLLVFARKPAPVQVTYLGYPATTGMQAMDYRITDLIADPACSDAFHSEILIRLDRCFIAFTPYGHAPDVSALPVDEAGFIRFVSFNHMAKIGPDVVKLWSRVLHAVPDSRLMVKHFSFKDEGVRDHLLKLFADQGIASERIEIFTWAHSCEEHLGYYRQADIALDSFPYNGTTTTCEALWMGVPVVTLEGRLHAGRVGSTLMSRVGLERLITADEDAYINIVGDLATDLARLRAIRATLRERMAESELCDSAGLTAVLEGEYREMWRRWLESEKK
ncbi:tetratricopeptide repeat protein [Mariprofundus sp. KV]|uniref:O-linked N-acetylglucosamine transferase, SPINDLY family protein n=1 Tax=Mariprofundus sp. KV TaxID=2608715 RepID=UPI0015A24A33|nr:tetratricopeptide repeat protein [Mariprofundus sp. KV]NWF37233.1 tetratricopeptide repeat protein [Mariprofundus sp. KV]